MNVYFYNPETYEYVGFAEADIDPVATYKAKKEVYLKPAYATFIEPPKIDENNKVALYDEKKGDWEIKTDYRGRIIYDIITRQPRTWDAIGNIPEGYALELKPNLTEVKAKYLSEIKSSFEKCLEAKIKIPKINLTFTYKSLENILKEKELGLTASRDDNDVIYSGLTAEQYDAIIRYLKVYGQLAYLTKWKLENDVTNCKDLNILKVHENKLAVKVDLKNVNKLVKLTDDKLQEYFVENAQNIK